MGNVPGVKTAPWAAGAYLNPDIITKLKHHPAKTVMTMPLHQPIPPKFLMGRVKNTGNNSRPDKYLKNVKSAALVKLPMPNRHDSVWGRI